MKKILLLLLVCLPFVAKANDDDQILNAMRDEISRSMDELKLENLEKPYYIEYSLSVMDSYAIKAELGAVNENEYNQVARLTVGVRVGDYQFDNTNFFDIGLSFFGSSDDEERYKSRRVPIDLDYQSLRRELWLATDAAYKQSAELLSKKEATIKNRMRKDTTHDFLRVEARKSKDVKPYPNFDDKYFAKVAEKLSGLFKDVPAVQVSGCNIEFQPQTIYYANSEGMEYVKTKFFAGLEVIAATQATDGMPLADFYTAYAKDPKNLPSLDSLTKAINIVKNNINAMVKASALEETYAGPVIFADQAAAEMFAQVFVPNLVAQRESMTEGGVQTSDRYGAFQRKIGGRVLPEFMSVDAFPTKSEFEGVDLLGNYKIDDDGLAPKDVNLVKEGYLKHLLSSRVPTRRVRESNGHKRGGAPMYSNIIVSAKDKQMSYSDMKERMMELCKDRELPYGLVIKKVMNQNLMYTSLYRMTKGAIQFPRSNEQIIVLEAYKVFPDGKEELVRGALAKGFTVQSFKDIINIGEEEYVQNLLAPSVISSFMTGGDRFVASSIVTPDILFEDGEIRIIEDDFNKLPFVESPLSKK